MSQGSPSSHVKRFLGRIIKIPACQVRWAPSQQPAYAYHTHEPPVKSALLLQLEHCRLWHRGQRQAVHQVLFNLQSHGFRPLSSEAVYYTAVANWNIEPKWHSKIVQHQVGHIFYSQINKRHMKSSKERIPIRGEWEMCLYEYFIQHTVTESLWGATYWAQMLQRQRWTEFSAQGTLHARLPRQNFSTPGHDQSDAK